MPELEPEKAAPPVPIDISESKSVKAKREITDSSSIQPTKKKQRRNEYVQNDGVIVLLSDDEDGGNNSDGTVNLCGGDSDDDEVVIVDPSEAKKSTTAINSAVDDDADDEVQAIGEMNVMRLPHMRQHCTTHKFVQDVSSALTGKTCNVFSLKIMQNLIPLFLTCFSSF